MTPLSEQPEIKVSEPDKHLLSLRWVVGKNGYAYLRGARLKGKQCLMHRIVMKAKKGYDVHHKNGNKLDNRRENLEVMTNSEHQKHHSARVVEMNKARRKHDSWRVCLYCKEPFYRKWMLYRRMFCSLSCVQKNRHKQAGHKMSGVVK